MPWLAPSQPQGTMAIESLDWEKERAGMALWRRGEGDGEGEAG
jgi:hypothetical protein